MKKESIKNGVSILFCIAICLLISGISHSYPDIPDDNLDYPVLLIDEKGVTGSGFFYNRGDATYLITARHVLFQETSFRSTEPFAVPTSLRHKLILQEDKEKRDFILTFFGVMSESERDELIKAAPKLSASDFIKTVEYLYKESQKLKLKSKVITLFAYDHTVSKSGISEIEVRSEDLYKSGQIKYHPSSDVAFIRIGTHEKGAGQAVEGQDVINLQQGIVKKQGGRISRLAKDNSKLMKDVIVGNSVFVFGYPTSITAINPWLDTKLPLLRKGIIAGKNDQLNAIILDCPAFYGNSGGLVIEVEHTTFMETKYKAIGLITNLVPYTAGWLQNSGYSIAVPMDFVEDLFTGKIK